VGVWKNEMLGQYLVVAKQAMVQAVGLLESHLASLVTGATTTTTTSAETPTQTPATTPTQQLPRFPETMIPRAVRQARGWKPLTSPTVPTTPSPLSKKRRSSTEIPRTKGTSTSLVGPMDVVDAVDVMQVERPKEGKQEEAKDVKAQLHTGLSTGPRHGEPPVAFMSHKPEWIVPRQDTLVAQEVVQIGYWQKRGIRLHVVELRRDLDKMLDNLLDVPK
jgi:hypothetical protein